VKALSLIASVALVALTAACERELILPGERETVRGALNGVVEEGVAPGDAQISRAIALPGTVNLGEWTHRSGSVSHKTGHLALRSGTLARQWSVKIGEGDTRKQKITADPIFAAGRIYTIDSAATVVATAPGGGRLWSHSLVPGASRGPVISGGGLAYGNGLVFASSGYGEVTALDPATGGVVWEQDFDAPVAGTPTVADGMVYVVSRDNRAFAINAATGRLEWQMPGIPTTSVMVGGSAPAVSSDSVIFPLGTSEVVTALKQSGIRRWGAQIAGERRGRAYADITDITGDPVIDGNTVYVGTQGGRTAAFDVASGTRKWTALEGAYSPVWPVAGSVFLVSDQAQLVRLDAATGATIWAVDLPYYKKAKVKRRKAVFAHYGPILAGGRLLVASDDGLIRSFDPATGALTSTTELPGGASSNPIVVNGTLYIVSGNGQLNAFR
jgi:outer membrane protein assembly factor BamB